MRPGDRWFALVLGASVLAASASCREPARTAPLAIPVDHEIELGALHGFENQRRLATDFAHLPPSDQTLGPDPYRMAALHGDRIAGVLRGESALVVIDHEGHERLRLPSPRSPSGLAVSHDGDADDILVVGEGARELAHYRFADDKLTRVRSLPVNALAMRDLALSPDGKTAYIVEELTGRLLVVGTERAGDGKRGDVGELSRCNGPTQVVAIADVVATNCLLDHRIDLWRTDGSVLTSIKHDGPIWRFTAAREPDGGVLIAAGGVEDHPLVREDGGFGYIDSFVYLYHLPPGAQAATRLAAINTSELGVVTPKWLTIARHDADETSVSVAGYATADLLTLRWSGGNFAAAPQVTRRALVPGLTAGELAADGSLIAADPLLDSWVVERVDEQAPHLMPVATAQLARTLASRLGELLFFTTMMAPWNSSEGKLSRFTCETCHHEGYVDGRVHYTGRDDVHAVTRPLLGLGNLRPYFSRALDKSMSGMVHAEFRVANRHNGRDPWFSLSHTDIPWLDYVVGAPSQLSPVELRQAFMTFLADFSHRFNPAAVDHTQFTERERTGAQVFRDRCAHCHEARLVADDPRTVVPFERWESLILSPSGPLVWSNTTYQKTGVLPYVNEQGARVAPLRRLYKKWPYFTNGSARSLDLVLGSYAASADGKITYHDGAPADAGLVMLTDDERDSLHAFLDLL